MKSYLVNLININVENSMIRITGGKFRSRLLEVPNNGLTKPTMDKVRLGVFSSLSDKVIDAKVLDLFSGSGSYGFEAMSRGAKSVDFVDNGALQIKTIKENATKLDVKANIYKDDVVSFLNGCNDSFDLIFMDPPYKLDIYLNVLYIIKERNLLAKNGVIIIESEKELKLDNLTYAKIKEYKHGIARVYILWS